MAHFTSSSLLRCARVSGFLLVLSLAGSVVGCFGSSSEPSPFVDAANPGSAGGANGGASGGVNGAGGAGGAGANVPGDCRERWNPGEIYHPDGYGAAAVHGLDFKLQADTCNNCHGDQLLGCAGAVSCDNCHDGGHPLGWRENCTYCHGGLENDSGAPPTDLDRTTAANAITFTAHTKHLSGDTHPVFDCNQCHVQPTDVSSPGHSFDETKGAAEVVFAGGLSPAASFDGPGTASCSNLYCHGTGLAPGDYAVSQGKTTCDSCHGTAKDRLDNLTYDHTRHMNAQRTLEALTCASCHANTDKAGAIVDGTTHVDGQIQVEMAGVTYDPSTKTCNGSCHTGYPHDNVKWEAEASDPFGDLFGGLFGP